MSKKSSLWASDDLLDNSDIVSLGNFTYLHTLKGAAATPLAQTRAARPTACVRSWSMAIS